MKASVGIDELYEEFQRRKRRAWEAGLAEYGREKHEPFRGDAAAEAASEAIDFSNYADQLALEGRISEEERGAWEALMLEAFLWAARVRQEAQA